LSEAASPFAAAPDGVRVRLRVTPGARQTCVGAILTDAEGLGALRVAVTAAPEGGKANAAAIRALAKAWRLPKTSLSITRGASARGKTLLVAGQAAALMDHLNAWMETHAG
jgi:uncharacterized protein YggU (UPF0235/DUF167 family)